MEKSKTISVPAKVNLSLKITGVRDGLHTLEMETVSVDLCDKVTYSQRECGGIKLEFVSSLKDFDEGRFRPVVESAVDKFVKAYGNVNADVLVEKNVPLGAGIGGSSTAVVGVLKALSQLKNTQLDDLFLMSIASDVPVVWRGGHNLVKGVGEVVTPLDQLKKHFVLIVKGGVDSGEAYKTYDKIGCATYGVVENHLEKSARLLNPSVVEAREILENLGAKTVGMSGSGSTVFACFDTYDEAKEVYEKVDGFDKYLTKSF